MKIKEILTELTYDQMHGNIERSFPNTRKRQHATQPINVANMKVTPYVNSNELKVDSVAQNTESHSRYNTTVLFQDVEFEDEDTDINVTFKAVDGKDYNVQQIEPTEHNCKVRCQCNDFRYRFAPHNHRNNALNPPPFPPYIPMGLRPSVNPDQVPGVCKHLIKLVMELRRSGLIV